MEVHKRPVGCLPCQNWPDIDQSLICQSIIHYFVNAVFSWWCLSVTIDLHCSGRLDITFHWTPPWGHASLDWKWKIEQGTFFSSFLSFAECTLNRWLMVGVCVSGGSPSSYGCSQHLASSATLVKGIRFLGWRAGPEFCLEPWNEAFDKNKFCSLSAYNNTPCFRK